MSFTKVPIIGEAPGYSSQPLPEPGLRGMKLRARLQRQRLRLGASCRPVDTKLGWPIKTVERFEKGHRLLTLND
jgi:hypothetical protein